MLSKLSSFARKIHNLSFNKPIMKAMPSIRQVETTFENGDYIYGAGWLWKPNFVISCHHCVSSPKTPLSTVKRVCLSSYDGEIKNAKVIFTDEYFNISMLEIEKDDNALITKFTMHDDSEVGDAMITISCGHALPFVAQVGIFCNKEMFLSKQNMELIKFACHTPMDAHGGLLFNQSGIAVGMILTGNDNFGYAIPMGTLFHIILQIFKNRSIKEIMLSKFPSFLRKIHNLSLNEPIMKAMPSILRVESFFENGLYINGAGWLWKSNFVISCHNCVSFGESRLSKVLITFYDGEKKTAEVKLKDNDFNIAMLKIEKHSNAIITKFSGHHGSKIGTAIGMIHGQKGGSGFAIPLGTIFQRFGQIIKNRQPSSQNEVDEEVLDQNSVN